MKSGEQYKPNQFNTNQFQTSSPYPQKQPKNAKGYSTYQINPNDEEINDDPRFHHSFNNSVVRAKFIRKVYTILTLQLSFTVIFVLPFMFIDEVQEFVDDYFMLVYVEHYLSSLTLCSSVGKAFEDLSPQTLYCFVL
uniref:Uncharacterized protein n=1 Tax=Clastoptera arizonana TaxID=38151 RepID=A0A1B6E5D2_9HEMI